MEDVCILHVIGKVPDIDKNQSLPLASARARSLARQWSTYGLLDVPVFAFGLFVSRYVFRFILS